MASHFTIDEREFLATHRSAHQPMTWIAEQLGRDPSTLYRELKRNSRDGHYSPSGAQQLADQRRCAARHQACKLLRPEVRQFVIAKLRLYWSPEQIAALSKEEFPGNPRLHVSDQTIYSWIHRDDHRRRWERLLRRYRRRKRRVRSTPKERLLIAVRPAEINERTTFGHWEGDTIVGPYHRGGALVTLVERRSRLTELIYVPNLTTRTVTRAIFQRLRKYPPHLRLSLTLDRGSEFADDAWLKRALRIDVYFADPGRPYQRGTNENTNGLVRQFFPKGTPFRLVSRYRIEKTQHLLNHRPRKCLGFQTPNDVFLKTCCLAIQT